MSEKNKEIARLFINGLNQGNLNIFDELVAPNFVDRTTLPGADSTRKGWKEAYEKREMNPFPDLHFHIEEQIAEGDLVVTLSKGHGTHQGEFMGIPATGKEVTGINITIFRITDGKIIERWTAFDSLSFLAQLGGLTHLGNS